MRFDDTTTTQTRLPPQAPIHLPYPTTTLPFPSSPFSLLNPHPLPAKPGGINLYIENVPPGDDYVVVFMNSTHGVLLGTSERFTILPSSGTPTSSPQPLLEKAATVSVTTGPNPTVFFATTFPALPWSAGVRWAADPRALVGVVGAAVVGVVSASCVLL